jgi:hypothetical protein
MGRERRYPFVVMSAFTVRAGCSPSSERACARMSSMTDGASSGSPPNQERASELNPGARRVRSRFTPVTTSDFICFSANDS